MWVSDKLSIFDTTTDLFYHHIELLTSIIFYKILRKIKYRRRGRRTLNSRAEDSLRAAMASMSTFSFSVMGSAPASINNAISLSLSKIFSPFLFIQKDVALYLVFTAPPSDETNLLSWFHSRLFCGDSGRRRAICRAKGSTLARGVFEIRARLK